LYPSVFLHVCSISLNAKYISIPSSIINSVSLKEGGNFNSSKFSVLFNIFIYSNNLQENSIFLWNFSYSYKFLEIKDIYDNFSQYNSFKLFTLSSKDEFFFFNIFQFYYIFLFFLV